MTSQYPPPVDPSVFVMSLAWALISALVFVLSIRMGTSRVAWFWALSFVVASVIAAVFFLRLVGGGT